MSMSTTSLLNILKPKSSPFPLVRVGGCWDGAYLIPDVLVGIDACFSPGVCNFKRFEDELALKYGIKSHMCDFSSDIDKFETPLIKDMQTFRRKWLDVSDSPDCISLDDWVEDFCSDPHGDLMLQMDIEGSEYRNLLDISESTLKRFRVLVIELHGLDVLSDISNSEHELALTLRKLNKFHTCVHVHPNNCSGAFLHRPTGMNVPNVLEVSFLRNDYMDMGSGRFYPPQLPHPSDISFNANWNPPLHLNKHWSNDQTIGFKRLSKIAFDFFLYYIKSPLSKLTGFVKER